MKTVKDRRGGVMQATHDQTDSPVEFINPLANLFSPQISGAVSVSHQSSPAGEYGVGVTRFSSSSRTCLGGTATHHMIGVICSDWVSVEHMIAGKRLYHEAGRGTLCICPSGAQHFSAFGGPMDGIVMRISPECLAVAREALAPHGTLVERIEGEDPLLAGLAWTLEAEAAANHPNGMLFWSSATDALLRHLTANHLSSPSARRGASLEMPALKRLEDFIQENLAEPLDLGRLAAVVGCNRFHFARLFRSTVGITPYRYVVRCRLQRARALLHEGKNSLAEIAVATGFSDQSHLSKWIGRIYGTTPRRLTTHH